MHHKVSHSAKAGEDIKIQQQYIEHLFHFCIAKTKWKITFCQCKHSCKISTINIISHIVAIRM